MMSHHLNDDYRIVGMNRVEKYLCIVSLLAGGAVLGYFFKRILEWVNRIGIFSDDSKISFITKITNTLHSALGGWATLFFMMLGLLLGLYIIVILLKESPTVTVTEHLIEVKSHAETFTYTFDEIKNIYYDKNQLVIVSMSGHELLRKSYEINKNNLENALQDYKYPFSFQDPYEGVFKKWSADFNELSTAQNALLKAREVAKKHEDYEEVDKLARELSKLNIVVKDKGNKQYWRFAIT